MTSCESCSDSWSDQSMSLGKPSAPALGALIDRLQLRLNARATAATREWWVTSAAVDVVLLTVRSADRVIAGTTEQVVFTETAIYAVVTASATYLVVTTTAVAIVFACQTRKVRRTPQRGII